MSFWNEENGDDLKMENRKNHADLLQTLRGYKCDMVREVGQENKNRNMGILASHRGVCEVDSEEK